MAKRPSPPRASKQIQKLIEDLPFLVEIDKMLIEGTPATAVAQYIQVDRGELTDVKPASLVNELRDRRSKLQNTTTWWGIPPLENEEDDLLATINYRRAPTTPGRLARTVYERTEGGVKDMLELESIYLAQRDRCDRLMELESITGMFGDITTNALDSAAEMLWKRIQARAKMGEGAADSVEVNLSVKNYSENTVKVLSNPESRRRILSLLERLVRYGKNASLQLPMPQPQTDKE